MATKTSEFGTVYGKTYPVWAYTITWGCGHVSHVKTATGTPAKDTTFVNACPKCYTGPYFNVWD